jgi:hypothetical protein
LTLEHLIPDALGGKLTSSFLCKSCNSQLGHRTEGKTRTDPTVRLLAARLRANLPKLASRLAERQTYVAVGPGPKSTGYIKNGAFIVRSKKLDDGSLLQPTPLARESLKKMLTREGASASSIEVALQLFDDASENTRVGLPHGIEVVKWSVTGLQPSLEGPLLDPVVALKCAYEFLALHVGTAIYQEMPALSAIRVMLREGRVDSQHAEVERLQAQEASPFHGIVFEGNHPYAKVQIRIFGQLAFRVHFKHLSVAGARGMYTHDLTTNEEHVAQLPENSG